MAGTAMTINTAHNKIKEHFKSFVDLPDDVTGYVFVCDPKSVRLSLHYGNDDVITSTLDINPIKFFKSIKELFAFNDSEVTELTLSCLYDEVVSFTIESAAVFK